MRENLIELGLWGNFECWHVEGGLRGCLYSENRAYRMITYNAETYQLPRPHPIGSFQAVRDTRPGSPAYWAVILSVDYCADLGKELRVNISGPGLPSAEVVARDLLDGLIAHGYLSPPVRLAMMSGEWVASAQEGDCGQRTYMLP